MGQGRVELPTSRLSGVRSNHLSYWPGGGLENTHDQREGNFTEGAHHDAMGMRQAESPIESRSLKTES